MTRRGRLLRVILLVGVLSAGFVSTPAQESPSFVTERVTLSAAAGRAASANYEISATLGQEVPVGSVSLCNQGFHQSNGFWTVLGELPVPIILRAARNTDDPSAVDLLWTGAAPSFDVFRAEAPEAVRDLTHLAAITADCSLTDLPPATSITYYLVFEAGP